MVDVGIVRADLGGYVGDVELDRTAATRLQVDENRALPRGENVAWMRLAVEQLFDRAVVVDRAPCTLERAHQQVAVRVGERRRLFWGTDQAFGFGDAVGEMRRRDRYTAACRRAGGGAPPRTRCDDSPVVDAA